MTHTDTPGRLFQLRDDLIINVAEIREASPTMVHLYGVASYSITPEQWERLKRIAGSGK